MNDTPPEITEKIHELMRKKTPEERAMMGWSMLLTSRQLVIHAILRENPHISQGELRREFFLKFYGNDYPPEERARIADLLAQNNSPFFVPLPENSMS